MRVLVVGGTGFIGEHLCEELHDRGHEVTALARSPENTELPADVRTVEGDVTAYDTIEAAFEERDAAVNLAALSPLFRPKGGNQRHYEINREGARNVVRAAETHGVRTLVQMSGLGAAPDAGTAFLRSKGQAEALVRASDLEWVIFRPSVVFGDGDEFVPYTKRLAPPYLTPLPGGGRTRFQPLWVGDLVSMLSDALTGRSPDDGGGDRKPHAGEVYELGGPEVLTLAEVAKLAHAADGRPVNVVPVPMKLTGVALRSLDFVPGPALDAMPDALRMSSDQYRALQLDNTTANNDVDAFGLSEDELTTLAEHLGVDPVM